MPNITAVTGISNTTSNNNVAWSPTAIRVSVLDQTNATYARIWRLDGSFLTLAHAGYVAGYELDAALLQPLLALVPQLTWPPIVTVQPSNDANSVPTAAGSFQITATSEITISYQWQNSSNGGTSYANVANAGVYSNATTNTLNISNVNGLNNYLFRCLAINNSGTNNSNSATLTTDPYISSQPNNLTVAHPASAAFTVVAGGNTSITYQWQKSTDSGATWGDQSNAGVYTQMTTNSMNITNSTGLTGYEFRCKAIDSNGTVYSSAATLTVT